MILVKIELVSAVDPRRSREIGRLRICNDGKGTEERGDYDVELLRRGNYKHVQRRGRVIGFPRRSTAVWALVARALADLGIR